METVCDILCERKIPPDRVLEMIHMVSELNLNNDGRKVLKSMADIPTASLENIKIFIKGFPEAEPSILVKNLYPKITKDYLRDIFVDSYSAKLNKDHSATIYFGDESSASTDMYDYNGFSLRGEFLSFQ